MIRFAIYSLLLLASAVGLWSEVLNRRTAAPRSLAMLPAFALTAAYGLFMVARCVIFWIGNGWWLETPVSAELAMLSNGVTLAWILTSLVIVRDRAIHG